jgi:hypothetical protein
LKAGIKGKWNTENGFLNNKHKTPIRSQFIPGHYLNTKSKIMKTKTLTAKTLTPMQKRLWAKRIEIDFLNDFTETIGKACRKIAECEYGEYVEKYKGGENVGFVEIHVYARDIEDHAGKRSGGFWIYFPYSGSVWYVMRFEEIFDVIECARPEAERIIKEKEKEYKEDLLKEKFLK